MLPEVRLDTDSFKALIEEYRMQIASIFPEWSNYNYSDPGITLVELFAWMKENQQFYMEQLSPQHYGSFFGLMGLRQRTVRPAQIIASTVTADGSKEEYIPKGTVYYSEDIPYTTLFDNNIANVKICSIKSGQYTSTEELDAFGTVNIHPFGRYPEVGDTMELYIDRPLPVNVINALVVVLQIDPKRNPIGNANYELLAGIGFEYFTADGWKKVDKVRDMTNGLLFSGRIELTISEPMTEIEAGRYAIRVIFEEGNYDKIPFITNIGFNFVRLQQIIDADCCMQPEMIGEGNGFPSQKIKLPFDGVISDSVEISVEDIFNPGTYKPWKRVENFSLEEPSSECFMVDESNGEIIFGDGKQGLPPEGMIILTGARICRGFAGTAMPGAILKAKDHQPLRVIATPVVGRDTETLEEFKTRAKIKRSTITLATVKDYETQVLHTPGMVINSCKVLTDLSSPTKVIIAVRPGDGKEQMKLSATMEKNIYNHLEKRRLIGTQIQLMSPEYIKVKMEVIVTPSDQHTDFEKKIKDAIAEYFDSYGSFGDPVVYGKLFGAIDSLDCVERAVAINFETDKVSVIKSKGGDLIPPANGLFICDEINISF